MNKTKVYLLLLALISGIIYHRWISFSVFTYSDWLFYFKESLIEQLIPSVWNATATFGFGEVDIILWKLPVYLLTGIFGKFGYDYNVAEKFIVFWPIVFGLPLSSFFLVKYITKSNVGAFIGSLIFSFSTYFLSINSQGHEFLPASFVFATFAILFYIKLLDKKKLYLAVISGLFLFLVGAYDLRTLYITVGVLVLYLLYYSFFNASGIKKISIKFIGYVILPFVLLFLASLYWVLPVLFSGYYGNSAVLGRQLFGNEVYQIQDSLTLFFPFWTGHNTDWFNVHPIPIYFWLYPLTAVLGIVFGKKNRKVIFFALIALIGIFLSKQADIPFAQFYAWVYSHIPGFNAFREASKFNFLTSLGYAVLIGSFVEWVEKLNAKNSLVKGRKLFYLLFAAIILWNGKPILTGAIYQLYSPYKIPNENINLKGLIFTQKNYFRTFWINMSTHWITSNQLHPEIEGALLLNNGWKKFIDSDRWARKDSEGTRMMKSLDDNIANTLLDLSSVKYVIVPLHDGETGQDIVKGFGESYSFYEKSLDKLDYLRKVEFDPKNILIYENTDYRPHLYLTYAEENLNKKVPFTPVEYATVSPSEYHILLSNLKSPVWLNFTENYHPDWSLRVGKFNWHEAFGKNYFINSSYGKQSIVGFNQFYLDPKNICRNYICKTNPDGSFNIALTLYFKPQSSLYLGMILSGVTLFISLVYLIYYGTKNKIGKN